jgi:predicted nucleotidyltransferase
LPCPQSSRNPRDGVELLLRERLNIAPEALAEFCRKHHLKRLWLFGSVLRNDFRPESDVDVLYEFEEGAIVGWQIVSIEEELSGILRRRADMVSNRYLSPYIRNHPTFRSELVYG